jgi:phosphatidate cytidylyltransferase
VFGLWLGLPARHCLLLGAMIGVVGQLGDLGKSVLNRDLGISDFSSLSGPHGGVLDRFDAILVCMPLVCWYFWLLWLSWG